MDLSLGSDLEAVRDVFADFFTKESPVDVVRRAEPLGFDRGLWTSFQDLGGPAIAIPEEVGGGGGASALAQCLVAVEAGRRLAPMPLVETLAAAWLLVELGASDLIERVVSEGTMVSLALHQPREGVLRLVPAGAVADLVVGRDGDDVVAWSKPADLVVEPAATFAATPIADWRLDGVERVVLGTGAEALAACQRACARWQLLMSAMLNGMRRSALDIGVEYVKTREAFGVLIGWFQAIQHRLADVAAAGDGAELLVYEAAWAADAGKEQADMLASMSFLYGAETAFRTCRESLQFHGGYGYTLEYDIQLYYRRAKAWPLLLGDPRRGLAALAAAKFGRQGE